MNPANKFNAHAPNSTDTGDPPDKIASAPRLQRSHVAHYLAMRESAAWRTLPDNARRLLARIELEHMRKGGGQNGSLMVPYADFEKDGLRRQSIALAARQCVALGFLEFKPGLYRARNRPKPPNIYRLTYVTGRTGSAHALPTNEWTEVRTMEDAQARLAGARSPTSGSEGPVLRVAA